MKISSGTDGLIRRADSKKVADRSGTASGIGGSLDSFRQILESKTSAGIPGATSEGAREIPDEQKIKHLIEIIRLRMMLDEHLLGSMREDRDGGSLYQRFARWPLGNLQAPVPAAQVQPPPAAKKEQSAQAPEETPSVVRLPKASDRARQYEPIIEQASRTYGVDAGLIRAVIRAESSFKNESTSPKGAMGLMQIMPETAKDLGIRDAYDPRENIMGGTRYLKGLLDRYRGDVPTALAAYNWGMGNVERRPERLPRETKIYIHRIQQFMDEGKA